MFFNQKENVKKALKKFKILFLFDPYSNSWIYCWFYLYSSYKPTPEQPKYKIFSSYLERFVEQFYSHARTHACTMYIRMCIHIMYDLFRNPALPRFVFFYSHRITRPPPFQTWYYDFSKRAQRCLWNFKNFQILFCLCPPPGLPTGFLKMSANLVQSFDYL